MKVEDLKVEIQGEDGKEVLTVMSATKQAELARRAKQWEVAAGLSRKAFRSGRSLTGLNTIRRSPGPTHGLRTLAFLGNAGEMVYFFFDHFTWLSRIGVLDAKLAKKTSFISAFGESIGYIFFIISDFIHMNEGLKKEKLLLKGFEEGEKKEEEVKEVVGKIKGDRVMRLMAVAANIADLIIAVAEVQPNPVCCHAVTLGISGLVSAWAGWYRTWPS
ncbi:Peroxisomal membrane protein 11-4 [Bienertia sinuspersici]